LFFCALVISNGIIEAKTVQSKKATPSKNTECNLAREVQIGQAVTFVTSETSGTSKNAACSITNDVWFSVTSTCTSVISFSLCESEFDTNIALYKGDEASGACNMETGLVNNYARLACSDDNPTTCDGPNYNGQSYLLWNTYPGEKFLLRVGGYKAVGKGKLKVECPQDRVVDKPKDILI